MAVTVTAIDPVDIGEQGGFLVRVIGTFDLGKLHRVHVTDVNGAQFLTGIPSRPLDILPLKTTEIRCYSPELSPGTYDIYVRLADDSDDDTLAAALTVHIRDYKTTVYAHRRIQPPYLSVGPRRIDLEDPV